MDREAIIESVKAQMPERRWLHVQGVMATSIILAERFGADPVRAELAAILHDVAKYWPTERMQRIIVDEQLPQELLAYDKELWHAPVGAFIAERDYGITDAEVLEAIRYHTSGREEMSLLEKIVCLADYMEPGRDFPGVNRIREEAEHSVEKALLAGFDSTISFLLEKEKRIFPLTVAARNAIIKQLREAEE
ncbi:metal dependent phosphohydrolase [Paenibacillus curdlanolyticus YK9]|uniref:bis(5'-nucleosyl)-tetraphosphatase (symmetrical) n=1 Tax=Paenibacillus curdlanolyticus YK9 TaxID=717606 RepID=E0I345_9BACL|nr:bis(5'-nucleosyl)-tetraphosphatase (symmetrical) YqeK [Paenibacillus curdlanolyticus]EFM12709.1 metal dependent phosphohydrolase [Paenibacillus curdlanolyticus YK9]